MTTQADLNWIANFIWGIADDVLRDIYTRGKYRDVILPMTVIRRLDAVLEPSKPAVLDMKAKLDAAGITNQDAALRQAAGQAFYNASPFRLRDLRSRSKTQQLKADFEAYLDGFSANVQEILEKFQLRNQIPKLVENDILGSLIEKFLDNRINLGPSPVLNGDGTERLFGLDNHGMGTIFEELIRRFNEDNNEEAGEHFTPRDVVTLMADLVFLPIADKLESGTYLLYDGAAGTGGMLTLADERLRALADDHKKEVAIHLFGQEVNAETYAIAKADLLLKGQGDEAENFRLGSTLSQDAFPSKEFDFMLSNPPYGKSWKMDLERMGGKSELKDVRFMVRHGDNAEFELATRSSDGQLMFLVNKLSKMKHHTPLGSRIVEVHNGSSLFTGDAGSGESNIRQYIIENDWLEAIIALPLNMFYNTNIATYIWVVTNRKPKHRQGFVQLINAIDWYKPLRKNLGKKNCELTDQHIRDILDLYLAFRETEDSKIFKNESFGYWKITVEQPLRLSIDLSKESLERFKETCRNAGEEELASAVESLNASDVQLLRNFNLFVDAIGKKAGKLTPKRIKLLQGELGKRDSSATPVIKKRTSSKKSNEPIYGEFVVKSNGRSEVVEYETDPTLRETELVPFLYPGGVEGFMTREVLPYLECAWIDPTKTLTGYELSFAKLFYKPLELRTLDAIKSDIYSVEAETEKLLEQLVGAQ